MTAAPTAAATSAPPEFAAWLSALHGTYPADDLASFGAADAYARARATETPPREGEPTAARAEGTAALLAALRLDAATIRAALLLGLPAGKSFDVEQVSEHFGADVAALVAGVARMEEIRAAPAAGDEAERSAQAERLRKMLLAMVEDIRVVLIKLAERTAALRHLVAGGPTLAEPRARAAREGQDLFAPLADRLGGWARKCEP